MIALILTYHAVEPGPAPLCIDPHAFARHLDCVVDSGAQVLTVGEIADRLRRGRLPERAVAITFDDGYASVVQEALPLLTQRRLVATVFCVARRLGASSDWTSRAAWAPILPLAPADDVRRLTEAGWEVGSHGLDHDPLDGGHARLVGELAESRKRLEEAVGTPVTSFAYPYGVVPPGAERTLADAGYAAACTMRSAGVAERADPFRLPRVDAYYLRSPRLLRAALAGRLDLYLHARGLGARVRRLVRSDHVVPRRR